MPPQVVPNVFAARWAGEELLGVADVTLGRRDIRIGIVEIVVLGVVVVLIVVLVVVAHDFVGNSWASSAATGAGTSEVTSPPYCAISRMNRLLMDTRAGLQGR